MVGGIQHFPTAGAVWPLLAGCLVVGTMVVFMRVPRSRPKSAAKTLAFFHPFAECGGGGERVLWAAVHALVRNDKSQKQKDIIIYCQDVSTTEKTSEEVLADHANSRFNLSIPPSSFRVVPIRYRNLLVPSNYPRLTMIFQAFASIVVTIECLLRGRFVPDVWVDTTGWTFGYPLLKLLNHRMCIAAYVHYPTVSSDMLFRVKNREASYNNRTAVSRSKLLTMMKALYYQLFAYWYGFSGGCADVCMVNSSWTKGHVEEIFWWRQRRKRGQGSRKTRAITLVYPPCDCAALSKLPLSGRDEGIKQIVSLAQYRPEKNHEVQLEAVAKLVEQKCALRGFRVLFIGGCRDAGDFARVERLKARAKELGLGERVAFLVNVPFPELQQQLGASIGGLHSMKDEHFGISVVEYMAAGVIPIAHNSAGPRMDIVTAETGYLCETADEYALAIETVLNMEERLRVEMAEKGRRRAGLFSQEKFQAGFLGALLDEA